MGQLAIVWWHENANDTPVFKPPIILVIILVFVFIFFGSRLLAALIGVMSNAKRNRAGRVLHDALKHRHEGSNDSLDGGVKVSASCRQVIDIPQRGYGAVD